jgi:hypothetical protein
MKVGSIDVHTAMPVLVRNEWEWRIPFSSLLYILVRWITRSHYNHVVLAWNTGKGMLIVESKGIGVVATELQLWHNSRKRTLQLLPVSCPAESFIPHIGKKYDRMSFCLYYLVLLLTGRWIGTKGDKAAKMLTCSELVAMALSLPEPYLWMPKDLHHFYMHQEPV